jgi:hypothetical protein
MFAVSARVVALALICSICSSTLVAADVVTLEPIKDATLYENPAGGTANGSGQHLFAGVVGSLGRRRCIMAFDIAGNIPAGSTVNSAMLTLHMSRSTNGDKTFFLRLVTSDWTEGASDAPANEGGGTAALAGDATWIHTSFPDQLWNTVGGDIMVGVRASSTIGLTIGYYSFGSTAAMVGDVQGWVDGTLPNYGWMVRNPESFDDAPSSKRFDSSENLTAAFRPKLTINFTPGPACTPGDMNNDGNIDGEDVDVFVSTLLTGGTAQQICAGDVQASPDGTVTTADVPNFVQCVLNGVCP